MILPCPIGGVLEPDSVTLRAGPLPARFPALGLHACVARRCELATRSEYFLSAGVPLRSGLSGTFAYPLCTLLVLSAGERGGRVLWVLAMSALPNTLASSPSSGQPIYGSIHPQSHGDQSRTGCPNLGDSMVAFERPTSAAPPWSSSTVAIGAQGTI